MNDDVKQFNLFCNELNCFCKDNQNIEKEIVSDELAFEALSYISLIKLEKCGDYLLFLSSMNLLNSYIKQSNSKISYSFKKYLTFLLENLLQNKEQSFISVGYDLEDKNCLIFEFEFIQFSFHNISLKDNGESIEINTFKKWDGIRKQICAASLFEKCKSNKIFLSNLTYHNENLSKKVEEYVNNFKNGLSDFDTKF